MESGAWYCFHCGWFGTLKAGEQKTFRPNAWKASIHRTPPLLPTAPLPQKVLAWFEARGIPQEVVIRNRIAYGKGYIPQVQDWVSCIQFPFYRDGKVRNIKYRDSKKNFVLLPSMEILPFGLDDVADDETLIWVEGEVDKLSVEVAGFTNCVSVPNGAPPPHAKSYSTKFDFLDAHAGLWREKKHILAVDADAPGKTLEEELARRLGKERCSLVQWPEGAKDANEVLVRHGAQALRACIEAARPYPISGIVPVEELFGRIDALYEDGVRPGHHPGWERLAPLYTVREGQWTVVTGIPGSGKSEWLDALLVNLAWSQGWTFGIFSPENQPLERHAAKLIEKRVAKPFGRGPSERMTPEERDEAKNWVNQHFTFVLPPDDALTIEEILHRAQALVSRRGIRGMVIDPWNEIDHSRPPGMTETEYISASITKLRRFARTYGVHLWVVAHPTKLARRDDDTYPTPTLYDISGSAHWRNKADNGITVHRDIVEGNGTVEIHVQKIRFKEIGRPGLAELRYDKVTGRYSDR